jgi:hypothetical protein
MYYNNGSNSALNLQNSKTADFCPMLLAHEIIDHGGQIHHSTRAASTHVGQVINSF